MNDSTNIRETDAGPFKLIVTMESLEDAEQLVDIVHIEPYSIIPYEYLSFAEASIGGTDCDFGVRSGRRELYRVGDQIHEYLAQHRRIA